jgi:hypothetical protein
MDSAERTNSRISVEFESSEDDAIALGHEIERLWNGGQYDEALAQLGSLEARVGLVAVGISWRIPLPTLQTDLWESDVRIGNRDSLLDLSFVADPSSGNLFTVLRHGNTAPHYSVCMSTDTGATWRETFTWVGSPPTSVDAAAFHDHLYVVYNSPEEDAQQVRVRRFLCSDGSADYFPAGAMWVVACLLSTGDTMREVSLVSDRDDNVLYLYTLTSGGSVLPSHTFDDGETWNQRAGITSGASSGLDGTENKGLSSIFNFLSFYDASDTLRICRYVYYMGSPQLCFSLLAGGGSPTSISAYRDTVICAYEDETSSPHQVRYAIRYGDGDTWTIGALSSADTAAEFPAVTARGGGGFGAVYRHCAPTHELRFSQRTDNGSWSAPVSIADNEPYSSRPAIEYLGDGVYGVAYLSDGSPVVRGAFFDRSDWPYGLAERRRLVTETSVVNVTPNPIRGRGRLSYTLDRPADLRVQVYDRAGRIVRTLFDGRSPAGAQSLRFDAAGMAPGVYFCRLMAGSASLVEAQAQARAQAVCRVVVTR